MSTLCPHHDHIIGAGFRLHVGLRMIGCTPRSLAEVEAEAVALICCESLGLGGAEHSRGYIQHWIKGDSIPERSAQRVFKAADQILKAGRPKAE